MMLYTITVLIIVLLVVSYNRNLPSFVNGTLDSFSSNTGGLQLLITSSNDFTKEGTITKWYARVNGSNMTSNMIEFQIYQPSSSNNDTYDLVYGNPYSLNVIGPNYMIQKSVGTPTATTNIPIIRGYIVGVYLPRDEAVSLLYDSNGADDDDSDDDVVYYWENVENRTCAFSLCTGKVLKGIKIQIGWDFLQTSTASLSTTIDDIKDNNPSYCYSSYMGTTCDNSSSSNTSIFTSTTPDTLSTVPAVNPSTVSFSEGMVMSSSVLLYTSSRTLTQSSSIQSTIPPPSSPPSPLGFGPELIAAFSVVLVLLCIVFVLIIAIGVCCCMRRKPIIESSATHGFDNPDYNGVVSSGSVKQKPMELTSISQDPTTQPIIMTTVTTGSPVPQIEDSHYYSTAGIQNTLEGRQSTKTTPISPPSISNSKLRTPSGSSSHLINNDPTSPSTTTEHHSENRIDLSPLESRSHYYSSPTTDVSNLSFPLSSGIYDTVIEEDSTPSVPAQDADVMYDEANICNSTSATPQHESSSSDKVTSNNRNTIYAYVPTSEQRKLLDWRYELPLDSAYNKLTFFEEQNKFWAPASTTSGLYEQLATNKYREISREAIRITNELGQGQFGSVSKGVWTSPDGRHEVAIKMLKSNATEDDRLKLLQEAAIMGQFSNKNVVKVQGVVTLGDPIMLVLEFMPRGDLMSYLRTIAPKHGRWHPPPNLPKLLLRFCRDIASGMKYLSGKSFVHRDLAARNILLSRDLTSKIGDFGMARDLMQDEGNYYTSSGGIIPIKWTAPEALNFRKYSTDSDVWSYGMVLFEIWSLGRKPFSELSNPIVIALINSKHCQAPPPGCPRPMYQLMVDCWHPEHSERPPFTKIVQHLESSSDTLLGWNKENNIRGKNAHILGAPLEEAGDLYIDLQRVYQQSMLLGVNGGRQRSKSNY